MMTEPLKVGLWKTPDLLKQQFGFQLRGFDQEGYGAAKVPPLKHFADSPMK